MSETAPGATTTFIAFVTVEEEKVQNVQEFVTVYGSIQNDIESIGCELTDAFALLGQYDFLFVFEAPSKDEAIQVSIALDRYGLDAETCTAFPPDEMGELAEEI